MLSDLVRNARYGCSGQGDAPVADLYTTIQLSQDVIDHFRADGRGWQTRIDEALREGIRSQ